MFSDTTANTLFNTVRAILVLACGWLVVSRKVGGLLAAAYAGALVIFVDHVLIKGFAFLLERELQAFAGVLISYVMFIWVEMAVGLLGGFAAKIWARYGGRFVT